ncbi:MAG TPA: PspA/IM30 family protein [Acidimicrobiales bacterium]|nr:PspA/IM30 family protein [Acidimicrobiales bacterium]
MLRRWWNYMKTWFGVKSKEAMDPQIEIEAAINEARENDQQLRNEAAKVIAHRTRVADEVEDMAKEVGEAKELARQALLKSDAAMKAGNTADGEKWNAAAQSIAMRLQASQKNLDSMQQQLTIADQQAEHAKQAVHDNAMRLEEIAAKRMEMLGQLEQAKMQESVNKAMASIDRSVGGEAPSLKEIEDKIQDRMAEAMAKTELTAETPEGAMAELEREVDLASANSALDDLRAELGLGPAPAAGAGSSDAAAPSSASPSSETETPSSTPPSSQTETPSSTPSPTPPASPSPPPSSPSTPPSTSYPPPSSGGPEDTASGPTQSGY